MTTNFDDLPTQPHSSSQSQSSQDNLLGRLLSLNPKFPNIDLKDGETTIGRRKECDVIFEMVQVSGIHCILYPPPPPCLTGMMIMDKSTNGTFVNGKKLGQENTYLLTNGDRVSLITSKMKSDHFMSYIFQDKREKIGGSQCDEIFRYYDIHQDLGKGNFSVVKLGVNKSTGEPCAIKILNRRKFLSDPKITDQIVREVEILQKIEHPNCVKYKGLFEGEKHIYIVLEYAAGGELFDKIEDGVSETEARVLFSQMLNGVYYLHRHGIAHRDLKPENILIDSEGNVKISDFGLARLNASQMQSLCGTPHYVAPEVIRLGMAGMGVPPTGYGRGVDMWSLGVSLYHMLSSSLPFNAPDRVSLFQKIEGGSYNFPPHLWDHISEEAKDLVRRLLDTNPKTRVTAEQALRHPWITNVRFPNTTLSPMGLSPQEPRVRTEGKKRGGSGMVLCTSQVVRRGIEDQENVEPRKRIKAGRRTGSVL